MSFILDALKKSEAERARQSGPVLLDPRIAQPRRAMPGWLLLVLLILIANLAVLAWVLFKGGPSESAPIAQQPVTVAPPNTAPVTNALPPPALPASTPAPAPTGEILPPAAASESAPPTDGLTIAPVAHVPAPAAKGSVISQDEIARLPSAEDLRVSGVSLPALELSLHAWDPTPANRFILMNSQKLREGNTNPDGVTVEMITQTGAVLRWRERRFLLTPGD